MEALAELPEEKIREWMSGPPALCYRFNVMSGVFHSAIQRIVTEYGCDASRIWNGRPSSAEVVYRFLQFRGAGPKIATMATNILARDYRVEFSDYSGIDISPDVHVRRVFSCLGLCGGGASEDEVMYRARALHPEYPGILDLPVWTIGTNWCKAKEADRNCASCYMRDLCPSAKPKY